MKLLQFFSLSLSEALDNIIFAPFFFVSQCGRNFPLEIVTEVESKQIFVFLVLNWLDDYFSSLSNHNRDNCYFISSFFDFTTSQLCAFFMRVLLNFIRSFRSSIRVFFS